MEKKKGHQNFCKEYSASTAVLKEYIYNKRKIECDVITVGSKENMKTWHFNQRETGKH